ncbi:MAG: tyrosine-type recombinase/integrase [Bacteroidetes bacterium]|nr:tyrosine-type recombinase/integrase [Bacteroidota bacterium]
MVEKFIQYIRFEKRFSSHTIKAYKTDLDQFYDFLSTNYEILKIEDVDHHIIRSWIVVLIEASVSTRSVNRKLSSLKSYFRFLLKEGIHTKNPMQKVLPPKSSKRLPVFIDEDAMNILLDDISFGEEFNSKRDKLIIELLYFTGMRLNELINIKIEDINFINNSIKILGKRNKERIIPLNSMIVNSIKDYMELRTQEHASENYLFVTNSCKKLYAKLVYRVVNSYLGRVSTINKKSPHVLRHTFATHMLNNGADLNAIKEILGHTNLSATQIYTHNTIEKLKSVYNKAHPKA